jgi:signal peptidase I
MSQSEFPTCFSNRSISQDALGDMWLELLLKKGRLWGRVYSGSMRPLIQPQDRILVERAAPGRLRVGDVALFRTNDGLCVHRILACWRAGGRLVFLQKGDYNPEAGRILGDQVLGRVLCVERAGQMIDLVSGRGRVAQVVVAGVGLAAWGTRLAGGLIAGRLLSIHGSGWTQRFDRLTRGVHDLLVEILDRPAGRLR